MNVINYAQDEGFPTLQDQARKSMGSTKKLEFEDIPTVPATPAPTQPETTYEDDLRSKMAVYQKEGLNPLYAFIDKSTPEFDVEQAKRLKMAAGINAAMQGISSMYGAYQGSKGGPVLTQTNEFTPQALTEYQKMIADDTENKYKANMSKAQLANEAFIRAAGDVASERSADKTMRFQSDENTANRNFQSGENKENRKFQHNESELTREQQRDQFDKSLNLNKSQHEEAMKMSQDQLNEMIRNNKAETAYKYYQAKINKELYELGYKGVGAGLKNKFTGTETDVIPVKMPDGSVKYLSGTEAYAILGQIAKREGAKRRASNDPMLARMGNNDFSIGEASGLIAAYGMDLLGVQQQNPQQAAWGNAVTGSGGPAAPAAPATQSSDPYAKYKRQ